MEQWKIVPFAPAYEVSDQGSIRRVAPSVRKRIYAPIKGSFTYQGYRSVTLRVDSKRLKPRFMHRIIMEAFCGPSDLPVNHKNGLKHDNRLENLEYVTAAQNRQHAMDVLDAYPKGALHPNSKLTESDIIEIFRLRKTGATTFFIAEVYGVTPENIQSILKRATWKHVVID